MSITRLTSILLATALLPFLAGCGGGSKSNIGSTSQADKSPVGGDGGTGHKHQGAHGEDVDGGDDDQGDDNDDQGDDKDDDRDD
jgi:hypothetical protein